MRGPLIAALLTAGWFAAAIAAAHELPDRVRVQMIATAQDGSLLVLVRVPLEAMRDVDFPLTPEGYLVVEEARDALREAAGLWIVDGIAAREGDRVLDVTGVDTRLALPGNRDFRRLDTALAHFAGPALAADTRIYWRQVLLDVAVRFAPLSRPDLSRVSVDVALQHLGAATRVELQIVGADGASDAVTFDGFARRLPLRPGVGRVAADFLEEGVVHILSGIDHLLFLVCLVLPMRRLMPLIKVITAFTVAHSITLIAAALGWVPQALWFPSLVESVIAFSIVFLAVENALGGGPRRRWVTAFVFGLAHGFGFASALSEALQFAHGHRLVALAAFNVGVEVGQVATLLVLVPALAWLVRRVPSERAVVVVGSLLVGHTGWHWMTERAGVLSGYFF